MLGNKISELPNDFSIENCLPILRIENWERHSPAALTRNDPVGARFDRACDPVFAPRWNPFHFVVNGIQRFAAQFINANEELLNITKYDRCLRAPAIRIRVMKGLF